MTPEEIRQGIDNLLFERLKGMTREQLHTAVNRKPFAELFLLNEILKALQAR